MNEISKRYKFVEKTKHIALRGMIKSLKKEKIDKEHYKRAISIITFFEGGYRTIKAELSEEDYKLSCNAHRDEQQIEIQGMLDTSQKVWEMKQIERFVIVSD